MAFNWDNVSAWAKNHGGSIVTIIVIFGALFAGVKYIISAEVSDMRSDIGTLKMDVGSIKGDVGKTNGRIDDLLAKALDRAFPPPNATKEKVRGSLDDVRGILALAKGEGIQLNPKQLAAYGQQVAEISSDPNVSGEAWNTLGNLLDYRSFLNMGASPAAHEVFTQVPPGELIAFFKAKIRGKGSVIFTVPNRLVPADQSFIYEPIESNIGPTDKGYPFVQVTSTGEAAVGLDGMRIKNVIFDGITIEYSGGPLRMENVYFINCKFRIKPSEGSPRIAAPLQLFTNAVLKEVPVSVSVS